MEVIPRVSAACCYGAWEPQFSNGSPVVVNYFCYITVLVLSVKFAFVIAGTRR